MKKLLIACGVALMMSAMTGCGSKSSGESTPLGDSLATTLGTLQGGGFNEYYNGLSADEKAKISKESILKGLKQSLFADTTDQGYQIGVNLGMQFLSQITQVERMSDIRIDRQKVYDAFQTALKQDSVADMQGLQLELQRLYGQVRQQMEEFQKKQAEAAAADNKKAGEEYLNKVKTEKDVKATQSGLLYKATKTGEGATIAETDTVMLIYTGTLPDGTEFDSSKGQPVQMMPNSVIPGFKEGLMLMNKGSKYTLYIPGELAYGENGAGGKIGPMQTLIFDVEVVDVKPAK